jgi:hypothetical protein
MGTISAAEDVASAVVYHTESRQITGGCCTWTAVRTTANDKPIVADAASELLRDVFGEDKMSVRSVLGVSALPLGAPVMLEVTFEVENKEGGN